MCFIFPIYYLFVFLLQTFFKNLPDTSQTNESAPPGNSSADTACSGDSIDDETVEQTGESSSNRSLSKENKRESMRYNRWYIKEILLDNSMWKEPRFWEQSLWQCVMEQVPFIRLIV